MLALFKSLLWHLLIYSLHAETILSKYYHERNQLIDNEWEQAVGGRITLNPSEITANKYLTQLKTAELDAHLSSPEKYKLSQGYLKYKDSIKDSKVYQIIKRMPKGAMLHVHSSLMLDADYILQLTYEDHLYVCFEVKDTLKLLFSEKVPEKPCLSQWKLLNQIRSENSDVEQFDKDLKKHFTLSYEDNEDINSIWRKFNQVYYNLTPILKFRPVREKYWYDSLKRLYNDNVLYVEIRTGLSRLYELDGTQHDYMYLGKLLQRIAKEFTYEYPDFIGVKLILTNNRQAPDNLTQALDKALSVKEQMPDFFAGFDLVGQEDLGKPLVDFLPALSHAKGQMNFFFHSGETNWYGTSTDENLFDAILLGTKRIGHGYSLLKHPTLMNEVRIRNIAVEVNVISNEVLGLVRDVRNHPLSLYLALHLPVVLSSDDPGLWGSELLTDDFFVAFMSVASRKADLRTLKQLALNSINYSAMENTMKTKAMRVFLKKWKAFIEDVNESASASDTVTIDSDAINSTQT